MRITVKIIRALNFLMAVLFVLPLFRLDLFKENYSTLSFDTRGYLYLLLLGLSSGFLLAYETAMIAGRKKGILMFVTMMIGVIVPHHYPYDLQGNIHLLLAYLSFAMLIILTFSNITMAHCRKLYDLLYFMLGLVAMLYIRFAMVTALSELIIILVSLYLNYQCYTKTLL